MTFPGDPRSAFAVGIPTLSRYDLLQDCLAALGRSTAQPARVIVIDNGGKFEEAVPRSARMPFDERLEVFSPGQNLGVAASWNLICDSAFCPGAAVIGGRVITPAAVGAVVLLNDDFCVWHDTLCKLLAAPGPIVGVADCYWACILLRRQAYETIGAFDADFYPATSEDDDYNYRAHLAGVERAFVHCHGWTHVNNGTWQGDDAIRDAGCRRYAAKWGGPKGQERYRTPFGP